MNFQQFNYNKKKKTASICHIQLRTEREKKKQKKKQVSKLQNWEEKKVPKISKETQPFSFYY